MLYEVGNTKTYELSLLGAWSGYSNRVGGQPQKQLQEWHEEDWAVGLAVFDGLQQMIIKSIPHRKTRI